MENVLFLNVEDGDDLIVSFVIPGDDYINGDFGDIKSLILLRTPKFEFALPEEERGVNVTYDDFPEDEEDLLREIEIRSNEVSILTDHRIYNLNIRRVDKDEIKQSKKVLRKMNFDNRFKLRIV